MLKHAKSSEAPPRGFYLSCERYEGGVSLVIGGIVSITEMSEETVMLASHTGRIHLHGESISLSVFENREIEVKGRIKEIRLVYERA